MSVFRIVLPIAVVALGLFPSASSALAEPAPSTTAGSPHSARPVANFDPEKCPLCAGFAGRPCPKGMRCFDDPRDSCDPSRGGRDCIGICVNREHVKEYKRWARSFKRG
jgi:hypothetical protein